MVIRCRRFRPHTCATDKHAIFTYRAMHNSHCVVHSIANKTHLDNLTFCGGGKVFFLNNFSNKLNMLIHTYKYISYMTFDTHAAQI